MANILKRCDEHIVRELDKDMKEKFRWAWFDKTVILTLPDKVGVERKVRDFFNKIDTPGFVVCRVSEPHCKIR